MPQDTNTITVRANNHLDIALHEAKKKFPEFSSFFAGLHFVNGSTGTICVELADILSMAEQCSLIRTLVSTYDIEIIFSRKMTPELLLTWGVTYSDIQLLGAFLILRMRQLQEVQSLFEHTQALTLTA